MIRAIMCTRVDYGSVIYAGLTLLRINQLQSVLNATANRIEAHQSSDILGITLYGRNCKLLAAL
jgi:hypothetical protein